MIAIILCAGFATRMYPLTDNLPKPLLTIAGRPVIDYLMDQVVDLPQHPGDFRWSWHHHCGFERSLHQPLRWSSDSVASSKTDHKTLRC